MCGIAGLLTVRADAPPPPPGVVKAMCAAIVHRGPDDEGVHEGARAHIGMRRLAIIDLAGGHQPMLGANGRVQLVFNGEIYNFRELRAELQRDGAPFHTDSDSEVVLQAYLRWGDEAIARLRGMFALAIVDEREQRTLLARDRIGKKPLYYAELANGQLAFGSELKCLHAVPGLDRTLDLHAARDYFTFGYIPAPRSVYHQVRKLPPSHLMVIANGRCEIRRYAQIEFGPKWTDDEATLQQRLAAELDEAVRIRLVSDVPFGAFLSGGIDSSTVCALMARHLSVPLKTFTIGFDEREFDEMPDARLVAQHIGADHHELVVRPDAAALVEELSWFYDEPFGDSSALPTFLVSRMAAQHVKMVQSGDGGDELFAGYERYLRFQQLADIRRRSFGLGGPALALVSPLFGAARSFRLRRIADRLSQPYPDQYLTGVAHGRDEDLQNLLGPALRDRSGADPFGSLRQHFERADIDEPMERVLYGDMRSYLVDDILVKVDRASMANSLEARAPLLDQKLIDFVARLPFDMKLRGQEGKHLLRRVARDLLPASVLDKPKQGFGVPLDKWFRGELQPMVRDTIGSRAFRERGLFNVAGVTALFEQHLAGVAERGELLWLVLNFERWAQRFGYTDPASMDEPAAA